MATWVYFLDLKDDPALIAEYEEWHRNVWPEVLGHIAASGIRRCRIDRAGDRLAMIVEADGPTPTDGGGTAPDKVAEWEALMDRYQRRLPFAPDQKWVLARTIFDWAAVTPSGILACDMDLFQALRQSYLTEGLSDDDVQSLVSTAEFVEHSDFEEIVRANDVSYDLYVLIEGTAEVTMASGDLVARLRPGSIIGEFAFFEDGHRSATVMSSGATKLIHLDGEKLHAFMTSVPRAGMSIYRNLGRTLCDRLRSANIQIERLVASL